MITSGQIKAARALIGWTARELAQRAEIGFSTLIRLESEEGVPSSNVRTWKLLKKLLKMRELNLSVNPTRVLECGGA